MDQGHDLECLRHGRASGEAESEPCHFDERYVLPEHRVKLLQTMNTFALDECVEFNEKHHVYLIDGVPAAASVSGMAHYYQRPFDKEWSYSSMTSHRAREAWPRLKYTVNPVRISHVDEFSSEKGALFYDPLSEKTVASTTKNGECGVFQWQILCDCVSAKGGLPDPQGLEWYIFDRSMTKEEIFRLWESNGEDARNRGTEAHYQVEKWLNSEPVRFEDREVQVFFSFLRKHVLNTGLMPFRTELEMAAKHENVGGCIDAAFAWPNGDILLADWKRSPKLETEMYGYAKMKSPFGHLDDCKGCAYALQLSLYHAIVEKYYGVRVRGRILVSIHPENPFMTSVPYLKDEAEYLLAVAASRHTARKSLSKVSSNSHMLCSKIGLIALDPVRTKDGMLLEKKIALVEEVEFTEEVDMRKAASLMIDEHCEKVAPPSFQKSWSDLYTKNQDLSFYQ